MNRVSDRHHAKAELKSQLKRYITDNPKAFLESEDDQILILQEEHQR